MEPFKNVNQKKAIWIGLAVVIVIIVVVALVGMRNGQGGFGGQNGGNSVGEEQPPNLTADDLAKIYTNEGKGFSITLPTAVSSSSVEDANNYSVDESYKYEQLGPGKSINGTKFTIPSAIALGTNLGADTYISIEQIIKTTPSTVPLKCSAAMFLSPGAKVDTFTDDGIRYSVASQSGAGAGNRYEEKVYVVPGSNPCVAIRYYIHYSAIENYPAGSTTEFDKQALTDKFDEIRRSLILMQG